MTIPDLAEQILMEKGPLKTGALTNLINERRGKVSNTNTIFVGLHRHIPKRFERSNGLWHLPEKNGHG